MIQEITVEFEDMTYSMDNSPTGRGNLKDAS